MSATGQFIFHMEEDAREMTRHAFILKYGKINADVWDRMYADYGRFMDYYDSQQEEDYFLNN